MRTIDLLRELQTVDSALDSDRSAVERVEAELADRSRVETATRERDERALALRKLETDQQDLELEVDHLRDQLAAIDSKLYGGRVGDAKELNNLDREAKQFRRLISPREDRLLALFEAVDQETSELRGAEGRLREIQAERSSRESELAAERERLAIAIGSGENERESLRDQADAKVVRTYDNLRRTRGGLAVAEVRQRTCQGCRISMTVAEETRARHGDTLVFCQSCGRILYVAI